AVSATHLPAEELAVTVHGEAELIDVSAPEHKGFRQALLDIYVPRYGEGWETFLDSGPVYARINATRMYTFSMPPEERRGTSPPREVGTRAAVGTEVPASGPLTANCVCTAKSAFAR